jgi:hypothetical protein
MGKIRAWLNRVRYIAYSSTRQPSSNSHLPQAGSSTCISRISSAHTLAGSSASQNYTRSSHTRRTSPSRTPLRAPRIPTSLPRALLQNGSRIACTTDDSSSSYCAHRKTARTHRRRCRSIDCSTPFSPACCFCRTTHRPSLERLFSNAPSRAAAVAAAASCRRCSDL